MFKVTQDSEPVFPGVTFGAESEAREAISDMCAKEGWDAERFEISPVYTYEVNDSEGDVIGAFGTPR